MPDVLGSAPAPTAPGRLLSVAGVVRAGQAGAGRAHSRCQQVRKASFQGQVRLIFSAYHAAHSYSAAFSRLKLSAMGDGRLRIAPMIG